MRVSPLLSLLALPLAASAAGIQATTVPPAPTGAAAVAAFSGKLPDGAAAGLDIGIGIGSCKGGCVEIDLCWWKDWGCPAWCGKGGEPGTTVTETETCTETVTQPGGTGTVTLPAVTVTVPGPTVTDTITQPGVTVTQPGKTIVETVTQPGRTTIITKTVTEHGQTRTVTETCTETVTTTKHGGTKTVTVS